MSFFRTEKYAVTMLLSLFGDSSTLEARNKHVTEMIWCRTEKHVRRNKKELKNSFIPVSTHNNDKHNNREFFTKQRGKEAKFLRICCAA